jgi:hypothetical protein
MSFVRPQIVLARELGVSNRTVPSDGAFAAAIDTIAQNVSDDAARQIRSGQTKLTKKRVMAEIKSAQMFCEIQLGQLLGPPTPSDRGGWEQSPHADLIPNNELRTSAATTDGEKS